MVILFSAITKRPICLKKAEVVNKYWIEYGTITSKTFKNHLKGPENINEIDASNLSYFAMSAAELNDIAVLLSLIGNPATNQTKL